MKNKIKQMERYYSQYKKIKDEIEEEINDILCDSLCGDSAQIGVFEDEACAPMIVEPFETLRRIFDEDHVEFIIKNKKINYDLPGC